MININEATASELETLGFSAQDALRTVEEIDRWGNQTPESLKYLLSDDGNAILQKVIGEERAECSHASLPTYHIELKPTPTVGDVRIAGQIQATGTDGSPRVQAFSFPADQSRWFQAFRIDLAKPISVMAGIEDGSELIRRSFSPAFIADNSDGPYFNVSVEVDLLGTLLADGNRFMREGRFVVPTKPQQRFDGYRLACAPVPADTLARLAPLLGQVEAGTTTAKRLTELSDEVAVHLSSFALAEADFQFDGSFLVDQMLTESVPHDGWLWLLSGPSVFVGFVADNQLATPKRNLTILLPTFDLETLAPKDMPLDVSEKALLDRPDVFSDDPGKICKPFDHPGRIVGERRFSTILRVTDPDVSNEEGSLHNRTAPGIGNGIDWEGAPETHQARSVAKGHIVEFRVRYRSNGYSLGNVAHSMTLAPRQVRRIVKIDFERRETAIRRETTVASDEVGQETLRERDYANAVQSSLSEFSRGGSKSSTTSAAAGLGGVIGNFVVGGGVAHSRSSSSAWSNGGRSVAAAEEQQLRDSIRQFGDSLRALESTVINEVNQSESVEGVSEVVRNINYCHSLSIVYYEILRHLRIDTEVGGVRECVFVPLEVKRFDGVRLRKHREVLKRYLRDRDSRLALLHLDDALRMDEARRLRATGVAADVASAKVIEKRIELPDGTRADQPLTSLRGSVWIKLGITRPTSGELAQETEEALRGDVENTKAFKDLVTRFGIFAAITNKSPSQIAHEMIALSDAARDRYFQREIAPAIARNFVDRLRLVRVKAGTDSIIDADFTIAGRYNYGQTIRVDFVVGGPVRETALTVNGNGSGGFPSIDFDVSDLTRREAVTLKILARAGEDGQAALPERSFADVARAEIHYTSPYDQGQARTPGQQMNDLLNAETGAPDPQGAYLAFPLTRYEDEHLRHRVLGGFDQILEELNANLFRYHKAIWWRMDWDALYTMLDGFSIEDAEGQTRSLAGIVERQPIGILGNSLIFRASAGTALDKDLKTASALMEYYKGNAPASDPMRISLPTSGLYARAHMDDCPACEEHEGSTDWVLTNPEPEAQEIGEALLSTRRTQPADMTPSAMPQTLINLHNAPDAPNVSGLGDILGAVTKSDGFRDMAGLAGTQANTRAGLETAAGLASSFGQMGLQKHMLDAQLKASAGKNLNAAIASAKNAIAKELMTKEGAETFLQRFAEAHARIEGKGTAEQVTASAMDLAKSLAKGQKATVSGVTADGAFSTEIGAVADEGEYQGNKNGTTTIIANDELDPDSSPLGGELDAPVFRPMIASTGTITVIQQRVDLSRWTPIINHVPTIELQTAIRARLGLPRVGVKAGSPFQPISAGQGPMLADMHGFAIDIMPEIDGEVATARTLLMHMKKHWNAFLDPRNSQFKPLESEDETRWESTDPTGAILHIDTTKFRVNVKDLTVVVTDSKMTDDHAYITVSTCWSRWNGDHPLAGNRRWEVKAMEPGRYLFRNMAADRPDDLADDMAQSFIYDGARDLWRSQVAKLAAFVKANGGKIWGKSEGTEYIVDHEERFLTWIVDEHKGGPGYVSKNRVVPYKPTSPWLPPQ